MLSTVSDLSATTGPPKVVLKVEPIPVLPPKITISAPKVSSKEERLAPPAIQASTSSSVKDGTFSSSISTSKPLTVEASATSVIKKAESKAEAPISEAKSNEAFGGFGSTFSSALSDASKDASQTSEQTVASQASTSKVGGSFGFALKAEDKTTPAAPMDAGSKPGASMFGSISFGTLETKRKDKEPQKAAPPSFGSNSFAAPAPTTTTTAAPTPPTEKPGGAAFAPPTTSVFGGVSAASKSDSNPIVDEIKELYRVHNPSKLADLNDLLNKYKGKEHELLEKIKSKYAKPSGAAAGFPSQPASGGAFGAKPSIGSASTSGGFASAASPQPTKTSSMFGAPSTPGMASAFAPSTPSVFGAKTSPGATPFSSTSTASATPFGGTQTPATPFGGAPKSGASFGQTPFGGSAGTPFAPSTPSVFGSAGGSGIVASTPTPFGGGGALASNPAQTPFAAKTSSFGGGPQQAFGQQTQSQPSFGSSTTASAAAIGASAAFGQKSAFGTTGASKFGQSSFGSQPAGGSLFGSQASSSGSGGSLFLSSSSSGSSIINSSGSAGFGSGFQSTGAPTSSLFGSQTTASGSPGFSSPGFAPRRL